MLVDSLDLDWCDHEPKPDYNVSPGQQVSVAVADTGRGLTRVTWGMVPSWSANGALIINARTETLAEKPLFATALQRGRCLVPATGYYEWGNGQSWYLYRQSKEILALAGIATSVSQIHPRMPAVVPPSRWKDWLDCTETRGAEIAALPQQAELSFHPVHPRVGDVRVQGPSLIEEHQEPTLFDV